MTDYNEAFPQETLDYLDEVSTDHICIPWLDELLSAYPATDELAAEIFCATQAQARLKREDNQGKVEFDRIYDEVSKEVHNTIKCLEKMIP